MKEELAIIIERLSSVLRSSNNIISWGSPVPSFGNISKAKIATLGLNPSNREFVDENGDELTGVSRRFPTLSYLGIEDWNMVRPEHIDLIWEFCNDYFSRNPYDTWFKKLDNVISGTGMSYYFPSGDACHLDLIPFATICKWVELSNEQKNHLLEISSEMLGLLLNKSSIELLVLNGQTVVDNLEKIADVELDKFQVSEWTLPRKIGDGVFGYAYQGIINSIAGIRLKKEIMVLGYNHNIQSSFGVTTGVQTSIRNWIAESVTKSIL